MRHGRLGEGAARATWAAIAALLVVGCGHNDPGESCTGSSCVAVTMDSLTITPSAATVPAGVQQAFAAVALFSDGSLQDVSSSVSWTISDDAVASAIAPGVARGNGVGETTVGATLQGLSASASLQVTDAVPSTLSLTPPTVTLAKGTSVACSAWATFSDDSRHDVTTTVAWSSSDGSVATVSGGAVTGKAHGAAVITATLSSLVASAPVTVTDAVLTRIAVAPQLPTAPAGVKVAFTATGIFSDQTKQDFTSQVTWATVDSTVATVTAGGLAQGVSPGATKVKATLGSMSASTTLTVTDAMLESIDVLPADVSIAKGTTTTLQARGTYSDGSTQDLTPQALWTSDGPAVTVSLVQGQAVAAGSEEGSANVSATSSGLSGSAAIAVTPATLTSLAVTPVSASVPLGLTQQLAVTGTFSDSSTQDLTGQASWSSSNPQQAAVSNAPGSVGLVTGLQTGALTVTATLLGVSASCDVTVTPATLQGISLSPAIATIAAGYKVQFTATGSYSDGSAHDLTAEAVWSSSSGSVAAVSTSGGTEGLATGVAAGTASITAALSGQAASAPVTVTDAVLTEIVVGPQLPTVPAGVKMAFTATGIFSDQTMQDCTSQVTWATADSTVATVTAGGLAQGVSPGATNVSATLGSMSASTTLTVTDATLESIDVLPADVSIARGTTATLQAQGTYSDGSTQDLTSQALWTSDGPAVTVSLVQGQAVAAGLDEGSANVSATSSGLSGSAAIAVTPATLTSLAVTPVSASVPLGLTQQLAVTGTFSDSSTQDLTGQASWSSSNPQQAAVSNAPGSAGLVTALQPGALTVTATLLGVSASCDVTVTPATLQGISLSPASATIAAGYKVQFTATGSYSDGSAHDLTAEAVWSSSNGSVAGVSTSGGTQGLATGVAAGTASITASIGNVSGAAALTVTSAKLTSVAVAPNPFTVAVGGTQQLIATGTFSDGSTQDVTNQCSWNSGAKSIAWVSKRGLVKGVKGGSVTITASKTGKKGSATGTVL